MKPDRNGPCPCGSNKKFKHCSIGLHNERIRWDGLEDSLRNKIDDYSNEFYYDKYMRLGHNSMFSFCQFLLIIWYKANLGVSNVLVKKDQIHPKKASRNQVLQNPS